MKRNQTKFRKALVVDCLLCNLAVQDWKGFGEFDDCKQQNSTTERRDSQIHANFLSPRAHSQ